MILIADSGSTKTDWCIVFQRHPQSNELERKESIPSSQSEEEIQQELTHSLLPQLPEGTINSVFFYGAGCTPETSSRSPTGHCRQPARDRKYQN